ncbi:MAG: hypothetical protein UY18_C0020G0005 [Microgenomates group bacterium GW2011_GWF2_47_9]|nr:MAG: hypothetical protein UY18_C0020G0005 [Microgenomates group bacterium GW2011_GWF2_47_9]
MGDVNGALETIFNYVFGKPGIALGKKWICVFCVPAGMEGCDVGNRRCGEDLPARGGVGKFVKMEKVEFLADKNLTEAVNRLSGEREVGPRSVGGGEANGVTDLEVRTKTGFCRGGDEKGGNAKTSEFLG